MDVNTVNLPLERYHELLRKEAQENKKTVITVIPYQGSTCYYTGITNLGKIEVASDEEDVKNLSENLKNAYEENTKLFNNFQDFKYKSVLLSDLKKMNYRDFKRLVQKYK